MSQVTQNQIVKSVRLASALVKKNRFDNGQIQKIVQSKLGVKLKRSTIAGIQRSRVYQAGKAITLVM